MKVYCVFAGTRTIERGIPNTTRHLVGVYSTEALARKRAVSERYSYAGGWKLANPDHWEDSLETFINGTHNFVSIQERKIDDET